MRPQKGKQKLFDAAIYLFEAKGYFATNIEQITAEAGVSKGLVYHYVKSKEELLAALITDNTSTMKSVTATLDSEMSIEESLSQFMQMAHTVMYQKGDGKNLEMPQETKMQMTVVQSEQLAEAVEFGKAAIGAPEEWLTGYFSHLVNRQELLGLWQDGCSAATGEGRGFDQCQTGYADLGFIVGQLHRGKGLGTRVFKYLVTLAEIKGLKPICSTEKGNIGAQKATIRAGLFAGNRIIQLDR